MESYGGAVIEWQPVIDSLSQSVIVLAIILTTMDNKQLYFFFTNFKSYSFISGPKRDV